MKFEAAAGGGAAFIRLKDKEKVTGVFVGEPFEFTQHWVKDATGRNKPYPCGKECKHCAAGEKPRWVFRINFVTKEGDTYVSKIFEQGWTVYQSLKSLHEGGEYDLTKTVVSITRAGSGTDTVYSIVPVKDSQLTPEKEKEIAAVKRQELAPQPEVSKESPADFETQERVPF